MAVDGRGGRGVVTLLGHGFGGRADMSLRARLGETAAEAVKWLSETSLRGLAAAGIQNARDTTVTVARVYVNSWVDQDNKRFYDVLMLTDHRTLTQMISFDTPQIRTDVLNASQTLGRRFLGASTLNSPVGKQSDTEAAQEFMMVDIVGKKAILRPWLPAG